MKFYIIHYNEDVQFDDELSRYKVHPKAFASRYEASEYIKNILIYDTIKMSRNGLISQNDINDKHFVFSDLYDNNNEYVYRVSYKDVWGAHFEFKIVEIEYDC